MAQSINCDAISNVIIEPVPAESFRPDEVAGSDQLGDKCILLPGTREIEDPAARIEIDRRCKRSGRVNRSCTVDGDAATGFNLSSGKGPGPDESATAVKLGNKD